tara:strand:+ start:100927 stop:102936 length:2010 start_codon:yes stop_codon:yes gene_type:complete
MESLIADYLAKLVDPLINPQKRVFIGYLFASIIAAIVLSYFLSGTKVRVTLSALFARRIWWSKSARADYMIAAINQAFMMGVMQRLVSKLAIATMLFEAMHVWFDGRPELLPEASQLVIGGLFTLTLFIFDDAAKYAVHRALHKVPLLWCFHRVHHTAETLTPFTVYRTHPVEGVIFALRAVFVQGITIAVFFFCFGDRAELLTILGANFLVFLFNITGANLRHSHVWISYGQLVERILISPAQHQLHHSVKPSEGNANFGAVLAIWDWLGGSLRLAGEGPPRAFGVDYNLLAPHNLNSIYLTPFFEAFQCLNRPFAKGLNKMAQLLENNNFRRNLFGGMAVLFGLVILSTSVAAAELNIYSHRQPFLIKPFLDAYKAKTGTKINIVYASKGLAQRLQAEGTRSPADVILTVDIARLYVYADKNLLAPVESEILIKNVPAHLRDPGNRWFAFSKRARVVAVSKRMKDARFIIRYEDLADPKWRGRICSRPGSHVYNRALVASMINSNGVMGAQSWAQGVFDNLARRPQGNDRAQVKAIYEGICDIAIINNYYFGKLKHSDKPTQRDWAAAVNLIFPNQEDRGTHVNISGGGIAKHSKNKAEAARFLEFLTSKVAQDLYGAINYEYPVNPSVAIPKELRSWGVFNEDQMPIARIAELAPEAQKVIDRVGW